MGQPTRALSMNPDGGANWGALIDELGELVQEAVRQRKVKGPVDRHGVPSSPYRTVKEGNGDRSGQNWRIFAMPSPRCTMGLAACFKRQPQPFRMSDTAGRASPNVASTRRFLFFFFFFFFFFPLTHRGNWLGRDWYKGPPSHGDLLSNPRHPSP